MINKDFNEILLHCTATVENQNFTLKSIDNMHNKIGFFRKKTDVEKDKRAGYIPAYIGYHYLILLDGTIEKGRLLNETGSHCNESKKNHTSIGISYVGGCKVDKYGEEYPCDTRTEAQKKSIDKLLKELNKSYPQLKKLAGHNEYSVRDKKACPSFNVPKEYAYLSDIFEFNKK